MTAVVPERPVLKPVRRGFCNALADRTDTSTRCGRPAKFYPSGWRCETHRPRDLKPWEGAAA